MEYSTSHESTREITRVSASIRQSCVVEVGASRTERLERRIFITIRQLLGHVSKHLEVKNELPTGHDTDRMTHDVEHYHILRVCI